MIKASSKKLLDDIFDNFVVVVVVVVVVCSEVERGNAVLKVLTMSPEILTITIHCCFESP